jgi:hypothetical protein
MMPAIRLLSALATASVAASLPSQSQTSDHNARRIGLKVHEFAAGVLPPARLVTLDGPPGFPFSLWLESPASRPFTSPFDTTYGYPIGGPGGALLPAAIDLMNSPLQIDPLMVPIAGGFVPATGTFTLTFPVANPLPVGWRVMLQAFLFDPLSTPTLTSSNGVEKLVSAPRPIPDLTPQVVATGAPAFANIAAGNVRDVEQGDVDGDGDLDLLTIACGAGQCDLHLQVAGIYQPAVAIAAPGVTSAEFADLDNDGLLDLVCASTSGPQLFRNGGFLPGPGNVMGPWNGFVAQPGAVVFDPALAAFAPASVDVETADVDGDGFLDVLLACPGVGPIGLPNRLFQNVGGPGAPLSFLEITVAPVPGGIGHFPTVAALVIDNTEDVEFADLDLDGDQDIVVGNFDGPLAIVGVDFFYLNQGGLQGGLQGAFGAANTFPGAINDETLDVCVGDLNGDGFPDVYVGNWYTTVANTGTPFAAPSLTDQLYLSTGPATFVSGTALLPAPLGPKATTDVEMTDIDLDGDLDLFLGNGVQCVFPNGVQPAQLALGVVALQNQRVAAGPGLTPPFANLVVPPTAGLNVGELEFGDLQGFWWDRDLMIGATVGLVPLLK